MGGPRAKTRIHEVLRGQAYPFDIVIHARSYFILDKDRRIVVASDNFPGVKVNITSIIGHFLEDIFETHELLFWRGLIELAWVSKACVELRASEEFQVYKIIIKAIWNDDEILGCLVTRFPYESDVKPLATLPSSDRLDVALNPRTTYDNTSLLCHHHDIPSRDPRHHHPSSS
jgi:hypothetical protein